MIKEFLNKHIWPFSVIHERDMLINRFGIELTEANCKIYHLREDIDAMCSFGAQNLVSFTFIQPENCKPIKLAYSTGLAKAVVDSDTDNKSSMLNISYVYSNPMVFHVRESVDTLVFQSRYTRRRLKGEIRKAIADKLIDQSYDIVKSMIFEEEIPE